MKTTSEHNGKAATNKNVLRDLSFHAPFNNTCFTGLVASDQLGLMLVFHGIEVAANF